MYSTVFAKLFTLSGIEVIKIGKIITGKGVELVSSLEKTIPVEEVKAFTHF